MIIQCGYWNSANKVCVLIEQSCATDTRSPFDCRLIPQELATYIRHLLVFQTQNNELINYLTDRLEHEIKQRYNGER